MKNRVIWKMFALTILTLGIYRLVWFVRTRREMMAKDSTIKIMSPWFLALPIAMLVFAIGLLVFDGINSASKIPSYCSNYSDTISSNLNSVTPKECTASPSVLPMLIFYVLILAFGPLVAVWLWGYSKGVEKITKEKTSFAMSMIVLLLVPDGIDILIIQDGFNKTNPQPAIAPAPTANA